jgi:hypothetical protein
MPGEPNPEAIAWYLERSEALLGELRERIRALRIRGGQLAGFSGAVLALAGNSAESILTALDGVARGCAGVALLVGSVFLIAAFMTALRGSPLRSLVAGLSADEVANYTTDRFLQEPNLWRVQLRTIRAILASIESTTRLGDQTARAVGRAERLFSLGLTAVGIALAILLLVVTF